MKHGTTACGKALRIGDDAVFGQALSQTPAQPDHQHGIRLSPKDRQDRSGPHPPARLSVLSRSWRLEGTKPPAKKDDEEDSLFENLRSTNVL